MGEREREDEREDEGEDAGKDEQGASEDRRRRLRIGAAAFVLLLLTLYVPEQRYEPPPEVTGAPFAWDQNELWTSLERRFESAREEGCPAVGGRIELGLRELEARVEELATRRVEADDPLLSGLERALFPLAADLAACPRRAPRYYALYERMRAELKRQSERWNLHQRESRARLYRLLYGGRSAVEELMLQQPRSRRPALSRGTEEPSATPSVSLLGVRLHSGDILLSRGGAPTSALIARGNDYPGNFSHVALVHVDREGIASTIESHIERGVVVAPIEAYLEDRKLRVMVLRPRADLPALREDPTLPHRAAEWARRAATARHIPYDFAMDFEDEQAFFCSEVVSAAYRHHGLSLWEGLSSMSSAGLVRTLADFGVRRFTTQGPADLEYDPQLRVVAEWRDPASLLQDHMDNAIIDVMLEVAETGERIDYDYRLLGPARILKAYSVLLNLRGEEGLFPEGMSATTGLRVWRLRDRFEGIAWRLRRLARERRRSRGHTPPYWELVGLARQAAQAESAAR